MNIALITDDNKNLQELSFESGVQFQEFRSMPAKNELSSFDALIHLGNLATVEQYQDIQIPVFISSVALTLKEMKHPSQVVRINGWPGFLRRDIWEIAGEISQAHQKVLETLGKQMILLPDEPGFVTARVLAMIINEAYFAQETGVSSVKDIDIAMKLGTNYPYGPFDWAEKIGLNNVLELLNALSVHDKKYQPCQLLEKSAHEL